MTAYVPRRRLRAIVVAAALPFPMLGGCDSDETGAPSRARAFLVATVRDADGAPVPGARLLVESSHASSDCATTTYPWSDAPFATDAAGRAARPIYYASARPDICVRVRVSPPVVPGSGYQWGAPQVAGRVTFRFDDDGRVDTLVFDPRL